MSLQLLDSDVLFDLLAGHSAAIEWFEGLEELPAVPGYVAMELIQDAADEKSLQAVRKLIEPLPILWPSEDACNRALGDFRELHASHHLGLLDALIAACALTASATLLTFNQEHYRALSGLQIEAPYERPTKDGQPAR
ncbi:MAG: PIN domain-containing protein [Acidobacteriota bacterium]|nr:PIN domain-containing protein [Acidobacteriota bacterium]